MQYIHELGLLFEEVQLQSIFPDNKTFPDCTPKYPLEEINDKFFNEKDLNEFSLKNFVNDNFELPRNYSISYKTAKNASVEEHIEKLWTVLTRQPYEENSSLITLPKTYVVPGGRFREVYYWDSYFTMLGLQVSGRIDLIQNMVDNFSYLLDKIGHIPNANRAYYVGRSQPPFFSLMVRLLAEEKGDDVFIKYLPFLEKEYNFWMKGNEQLSSEKIAIDHVVRMPDGSFLNRYWDKFDTPRPESYKEDVELSHKSEQKSNNLFRNLRAAAESGWDFSSRWFRDNNSFESIHTTEIIPVDLNCLLVHLEETLSEGYLLKNDIEKANKYKVFAKKRKDAIQKYCWNETQGFYFDYDFVENLQKNHYTLAASFPLFFNISSQKQAEKVAKILDEKFLKKGGLTTTIINSGQQWDAPNGWAPLQWIAFKGLLNYDLIEIAKKLKSNWLQLNLEVYIETGKLTEKYNVSDEVLEASGGEYPNQDGFGWTNGVYLKMLDTKL